MLRKAVTALRQSPLALLVLALGLGVTLASWQHVADDAEERAREQFLIHADDAKAGITQRLSMHIEILRGAAGLFAASDQVFRSEWKNYIGALHLQQRLPGIQGMGFIRYVPRAEKETFERRVRHDTSLDKAGYPDFAVFPATERDDYYPVEYFEPLMPDVRVLGLDHGAYPPGREALERARDSGLPAASGRLVSVVDQGRSPAFMVVLPVYRNGLPQATVEERRAALSGFVYARFDTKELLGNAIGQSLMQEFFFEVFDGGPQGQIPTRPEPGRLLYDVDDAPVPHALNPEFLPRFSSKSSIELAGRNWIFYFFSKPDSPVSARGAVPLLVLAGGILLSATLFAIVLILSAERTRVAAEVRRQKSLIGQVLDALPLNVFLKDKDWRYVLVNEQCARTLGVAKEEAVGKSDFDLFPQDVARSLRATDEEVRAANSPVMREERLVSGGRKMFVLAGKTMITPVNGEAPLVLGFSIDITERKAAEDALRVSDERLRAILQYSPAVIYLKDLQSRYQLLSHHFDFFAKRDRATLIGKGDHDVFPREMADAFVANDRQVLESGQAMEFEEVAQHDDGPHTYISVKFPLRDVAGVVYGVCGVSTDITDRLRLEREAAEARVNLLSRALTDAVGVGMIGVDPERRITFINPKAEELLGIREAEVLGKHLTEVTRCHAPAGMPVTEDACPLREVIANDTTFQTDDWLFLRQDGEALPVSMVIAPIIEEGKIAGAVLSFQDVSRRKQAEEALKQHVAELARINAELDEFTHVASHDLQEPLRKLIAFGDWLRRDLGEDLPPRAAKDVEFITSAASRMQTLVQDLLKLSRAGKISMVRERVQLDQAADRALDALSLRIEETGAEIARDPLPQVWGDPTLLAQLYQNLIGNALKFAGEGPPQIRLTAERQGGEWVLGVKDNGIGIRPEYAEQIFKPFKRLHGRGGYEGSGIGLAVCRKVVERHKGRIWVESEEGRGAHFKFALPAQEDGHPAPG